MAISVKWNAKTLEKIVEQAGNDVNFLTGTAKLALVTSAWTPAFDTDEFWSTPQANEVANGNGYATGGVTLAGKTITYDAASDQVRVDFDDVVWNFTAAKTWLYGVIYIDTAGAASADPIYAVLTWDTSQTVSTTYTLTIDPAGLLYIDAT